MEHAKLGLELFVIASRPVVSLDDLRESLDKHLNYQYELEKKGVMFAAGPVVSEEDDGPSGRGLIIIRAGSFEEARAIADTDPFHANGLRQYDIQRWSLNEGSLRLNISFSTKSVKVQ